MASSPYYAARLVTDTHSRVLHADHTVIEGLYAAGNTASPVMGHTYAGPGATIGPAIVFAYLAAHHIATTGHRAPTTTAADQ